MAGLMAEVGLHDDERYQPYHGRHENDTTGSVTAALARSILIRKLILLPKLKASALFQPEDHVTSTKIKAGAKHATKTFAGRALGGAWLKALHYGGIFGSGTLLFVGQELALAKLTGRHDDLDEAPPLQSGLAGAVGGALYGVTATPIANYLREGKATAGVLTRGLGWTLVRDTGGFALYFGIFTAIRGSLIQFEGADNEAIMEGRYAWTDIARRLCVSSLAGAGAATFSYTWRSPFDTMYKRSCGYRPPDTPLLSWDRFITSPRGMKAVLLGAATWAAYEFSMLAVHRLHRHGRHLERLDEAAFLTWHEGHAYDPEHGGRHHGHETDPLDWSAD